MQGGFSSEQHTYSLEHEQFNREAIEKLQENLTNPTNEASRNFIRVLYETGEDPYDSRCDAGAVQFGRILNEIGINQRQKQKPETYPFFEVVSAEIAEKQGSERPHAFIHLFLDEKTVFRVDPTIETILCRKPGEKWIPQQIVFEQIPANPVEREDYYAKHGLHFVLNEQKVRRLLKKEGLTFTSNPDRDNLVRMYQHSWEQMSQGERYQYAGAHDWRSWVEYYIGDTETLEYHTQREVAKNKPQIDERKLKFLEAANQFCASGNTDLKRLQARWQNSTLLVSAKVLTENVRENLIVHYA